MGYTWSDDIEAMKSSVRSAAMKAYRDEIQRENWDTPGAGLNIPDGYFDGPLAAFDQFKKKPWSSYASAMATEMEFARDALAAKVGTSKPSGVMTEVAGVSAEIVDWEGDARDSFYENFMVPFSEGHLVENQIGLINELIAGAGAQGKILEEGKKDVLNLGNETINALESLGGIAASATIKLTLGLVGAAAGIIGAVPTGGGTLTLALIGGGASIAGTIGDAAQSLTGTKVAGVMDVMQNMLNDLGKDINEQEKQVATKLNETLTGVNTVLDSTAANVRMELVPNEIADDGVDVTGSGNPAPEFRPPS